MFAYRQPNELTFSVFLLQALLQPSRALFLRDTVRLPFLRHLEHVLHVLLEIFRARDVIRKLRWCKFQTHLSSIDQAMLIVVIWDPHFTFCLLFGKMIPFGVPHEFDQVVGERPDVGAQFESFANLEKSHVATFQGFGEEAVLLGCMGVTVGQDHCEYSPVGKE